MTANFLEQLELLPLSEPEYERDATIQERWEAWKTANPWVIPTVERRGCGGVLINPDSMNIPLGRPSFQVKRSALTPPTVATGDMRRCIEVTVSLANTASFDRTGFRA